MRYFKKLGIPHRGDRAEANNVRVTARVATKCICAFTTLPHVFTTIGLARQLRDATPEEHNNEFATPRAFGALSGFIRRVILTQVALSTATDYLMGILLSVLVIYFSRNSTLLSGMMTNLALLLLALSVAMGAVAAISAIKGTRIAPAFVFSR
jgi:putative ABC transport system permease protein